MNMKTALLSGFALLAFAGNSVLCRLALSNGEIDPASFTAIRLVAGAITLLAILKLSSSANNDVDWSSRRPRRIAWASSFMLFAYAALFSFAYLSLETGIGALILFGSVQITMVLISLVNGNRLSSFEWLGLLIACLGLVYLVLPELTKPSLLGFIMMSGAGVAWGVYTVLGQGSKKPLADTASNFTLSLPLAGLLMIPFLVLPMTDGVYASPETWALAIASGAVTSGLGYAIWYAALPKLTTSQAGVMQLLVPIIASIGGIVFSDELLTSRLIIASLLTLGGILLVLKSKQMKSSS